MTDAPTMISIDAKRLRRELHNVAEDVLDRVLKEVRVYLPTQLDMTAEMDKIAERHFASCLGWHYE